MAPSEPDVATEKQPGIAIAQIFLDRVSFDHRVDALSLPPNTPPKVGDVKVQVETGTSGDGAFGFTRVTVSTNPENEPVYSVILAMTGVFARQPDATGMLTGMPLETFLQNNSLTVMYPFVREAFANITQRGRFGPVLLNPFNTRSMPMPWSAAPQEEPTKE